MENKKKDINPRSIVMLLLFVMTIAIPMGMLLVFGEAKHDLDGEKDYTRPGFKIAGFFNRSFQTDFENWFSTKYPLRPEIVELYGILDSKKDSININFLKTAPVYDVSDVETGADENGIEAGIEPETELEAEVIVIEPKFAEYVLTQEVLYDPDGYKGTDHVIIGKNGCLYENGYINEYYGFAQKYVNVTDEQLISRVDVLKSIQDELEAHGIPFCVVISPSKASAMPEYIPDWYLAKYTPIVENYVRPYERFVKFLEEKGVYFIDSTSLYKSLGLTNTFPKTGIHWNKFASYETCSAIIAEYERQTGTEVKHLAADEVRYSKDPPGFGNPEKDIFGIVYSGKRNEARNALIDDKYYWLDVYTANKDKPSISHMTIQGGSFTGDFEHYFDTYNIVNSYTRYYYNNSNKMNINWEREIRKTNFVVLEVNEQFVYNMGGNAPSWGQNDIVILDFGKNIIDSLHNYLLDNPAE